MEILRILSRITSRDDYDALDLLQQDHAAVAELFDRYESLDASEGKRALVSRIIRALTVHARIEEDLFYPALRQAITDQTVMEEADVEHAMVRQLMADLNRTPAGASHLDAKVRSLAQLVEHHVEEEEGQMFQAARASNLNLVAIGGQLDAYRTALESRYELDTEGEELEAFLSAPTVVGSATPGAPPHKATRHPRSDATLTGNGKGKRGRRAKSIPISARRRGRVQAGRGGSI